MLDLKREYLDAIQSILALIVPHATVWAYGSRVNGDSHEGSDLDLVVISRAAADKNQQAITQLRAAFSESNLPFLIDVLDWDDIPESFKQEINCKHVAIQE